MLRRLSASCLPSNDVLSQRSTGSQAVSADYLYNFQTFSSLSNSNAVGFRFSFPMGVIPQMTDPFLPLQGGFKIDCLNRFADG
jgi:hypothetical protein